MNENENGTNTSNETEEDTKNIEFIKYNGELYKNKMPIWLKVLLGAVITVIVLFIILVANIDLINYNTAMTYMNNGEYQNAIYILQDLDYKDSEKKIDECNYRMAQKYVDEEKYEDAIKCIEYLTNQNYKDSTEIYNNSRYELGKKYFEENDYYTASSYLNDINYRDSAELYNCSQYELGKYYIQEKDYDKALEYLKSIEYKDSAELVDSIENGEHSLNKFIERYNAMVDIVNQKQGISLNKISIENAKNNSIESATGAIIEFNVSTKNEERFKYEIDAFKWDKTPWVFADSSYLTGDWYCTIAGYIPGSTYESIGVILLELTRNARENGIYGSVSSGDYLFTTSKTKATMTFAGRK